MSLKDQKIEERLKHLAAEFLLRESNRQSLVTVTGIELYERRSKARILITVFPEEKQEAALEFARRKRSEFRDFIKEHARMQRLPSVDFAIDFGEKNRQRIDEISNTQ
ncbi:ribosome-binding factor A [Candidatus Parcubacteria bacterium]|nr:ribosome-binding factor A [Candidatus Parcubacteria bacterium]